MRRALIGAIVATMICAVACTRAARGDACKNDGDCAQDLRCMTKICTTPCTPNVDEACPKGFKCAQLDPAAESMGCVRE